MITKPFAAPRSLDAWRPLPMLATVAILVLATGCATLFNDDRRTVSFSSNPVEAEIWIDGIHRGITPFSLDLNNHRDHTVVFRKEGHQDVICEISANVGAGWIVLDVLGGLIPVIIDAATGAWKSLDRGACNVTLPAAGNDW